MIRLSKKRWLASVVVSLLVVVPLTIVLLFKVPDSAHLVNTDGHTEQQSESQFKCMAFPQSGTPLDDSGEIDVLVWNIYKQSNKTWQSELSSQLTGKQLGLLQEVSMTSEFQQWLFHFDWVGQQAKAFEALDASTGVFNITQVYPHRICAQLDVEPWLRLPKSALFATYPLSNGETLAVGNLHGINFTFGTKAYSKQLLILTNKLKRHKGPVILGGDFNTWSDARENELRSIMSSAGLIEVDFNPDNRSEFVTGHVLDHLFYRGLSVVKAEAPISDASDHNPLIVSFRLE
jgi:endonuclease/exonuclease/phosphatase (EEP) superfamily protein YafD